MALRHDAVVGEPAPHASVRATIDGDDRVARACLVNMGCGLGQTTALQQKGHFAGAVAVRGAPVARVHDAERAHHDFHAGRPRRSAMRLANPARCSALKASLANGMTTAASYFM